MRETILYSVVEHPFIVDKFKVSVGKEFNEVPKELPKPYHRGISELYKSEKNCEDNPNKASYHREDT